MPVFCSVRGLEREDQEATATAELNRKKVSHIERLLELTVGEEYVCVWVCVSALLLVLEAYCCQRREQSVSTVQVPQDLLLSASQIWRQIHL